MIAAREPKANNCPVPCLFYTQHLSGAAERTANFVLWDALLMGATEGKRTYQTIWVCPREAKAVFMTPLIVLRICTIRDTIQRRKA
jgi:hypothetical protein